MELIVFLDGGLRPSLCVGKAVEHQAAGVSSVCGTVSRTKRAGMANGSLTQQAILNELVERVGWEKMAARIKIRCFMDEPSIKSSLVFLRKTPWARAKVEELYVRWKTER